MARKRTMPPIEVEHAGFIARRTATSLALQAVYSVTCPCKTPCGMVLELRVGYARFAAVGPVCIDAELRALIDLHDARL